MRNGKTIDIGGGRHTCVATYGDEGGWPILSLHGTPASRLSFEQLHEAARESKARLLCPDRPGIGESSHGAVAAVTDYVADLDALSGALGIEKMAVLGWSAGAPYALALAALRPGRTIAVGIMAGVAPADREGGLEGLSSLDRRMLEWSTERPRAAALVLRGLAVLARRFPGAALASFKEDLAAADLEAFDAVAPAEAMAFFVEAFRQGPAGVVDDYRRWRLPWGFDLGEVNVPVEVWHGEEDRMIPMAHAELLAQQLPEATLHRLPGEGHISLARHAEAIFDSLRSHR